MNGTSFKKVGPIMLVGVHHDAPASRDLVRFAFAEVEPDAVCLELCEERLQRIIFGKRSGPAGLKRLCRRAQRVMRDALSGYKSGSEFEVAYQLAVQNGIPVYPIDLSGDRIDNAFSLPREAIRTILLALTFGPLHLLGIVKRLSGWRWYNRLALLLQIKLFSFVTGVKSIVMSHENMTILQEERDSYMSEKLIELKNAGYEKIMAVVGRNHLAGIESRLKRDEIFLRADWLSAVILRG